VFRISGLGFQNVEAYPRADRSKLHAPSVLVELQKSAHEVQFSCKFVLHALIGMYATARAQFHPDKVTARWIMNLSLHSESWCNVTKFALEKALESNSSKKFDFCRKACSHRVERPRQAGPTLDCFEVRFWPRLSGESPSSLGSGTPKAVRERRCWRSGISSRPSTRKLVAITALLRVRLTFENCRLAKVIDVHHVV